MGENKSTFYLCQRTPPPPRFWAVGRWVAWKNGWPTYFKFWRVHPPILETLCAPRWVSVMGYRGSHLGGSRWVGIWIAKKRYDLKTCKKHVLGIRMGIKSLQRWCIFHAKSSSCSHWKITTFHLSRYTDGAKGVTKNHSFVRSKFIFFYMQNFDFHRSR